MAGYFLNLWSVPYFISFLVCLGLSIFLLHKRKKGLFVQMNAACLFFTSMIAVSAAMASCSLDIGTWTMWISVHFISTAITLTVLSHFALLYRSRGTFLQDKRLLVIYAVPVIFLVAIVLAPDRLFANIVEADESMFGLYSGVFLDPSGLMMAFNNAQGILSFLPIAIFTLTFRQVKDPELKRRLSYFLLGSLFPFIGYVIMVICIAVLSLPLKVNVGIVFMTLTGGTIAYGIVKDHLLDIEIIVRRSFVYTFLSVALTVVFLVVEEALEEFLATRYLGELRLSGLFSAGCVLVISFPVRTASQRLVDGLFGDVKEAPGDD